MSRYKIQCPLCKAKIPSDAVRCSHCAGDLSGKEIQEKIQKQIKRQKMFSCLIGVLIILVVFLAASGSDKPSSNYSNNSVPSIPSEQPAEIVFDIPSLIRKGISEIKAILGKPISEYEYSGTVTATYQKNNYELQIDYLNSTGNISEIFLAKNSNSKSELLNAGNLDENNSLYSVKLQPSLRPDIARYTGVHVYPGK